MISIYQEDEEKKPGEPFPEMNVAIVYWSYKK